MDKDTYQYFHYNDVPKDLINQLVKRASQSPYRQAFHIEADSGYLNDPNGFSYFNGRYHLFYQWSPINYAEGNVWYQGWHHLVSEDLVHWQSLGPGIEPTSDYETHGAYSGSALDLGEELLIFYTGNTRNKHWQRKPYQIIARMDKNNRMTKELPPTIQGQPSGYTDHFRDPKLWRKNGKFYAVVGIQREDLTGAALVLTSEDSSHWQIAGELSTGLTNFGYMWECPDYFEIEDTAVLIFSPQGLAPQGDKYQNIYQTGYIIGQAISSENLTFSQSAQFVELDRGFDFYAPQSSHLPDGRRVLFGWMGLPEIQYPTEEYDYCGCLTCPRAITYRNGQLYQYPVSELNTLRAESITIHQNESYEIFKQSDMEVWIKQANHADWQLNLGFDEQFTERLIISFNHQTNCLYLDRSHLNRKLATEYGSQRCIFDNVGASVTLRILMDTSSIEIFVNQGATAASARFFVEGAQRCLRFDGQDQEMSGKIWRIKGAKIDE